MTDLLSLYPGELRALLASLGEPAYRAGQIFPLLHRGCSLAEMTCVGRATRAKLSPEAGYRCALPTVRRRLESRLDGTVKYLFELYDGQCVETVLMRYRRGLSVCVSTQVGCRMGCRFCASTIGGKVRDLGAGEILGQVIAAQRDASQRVASLVLMGIGEPLDNYDNVVRFLRLVSDPGGLNIGCRRVSLSTCGIVPNILRLAEEGLPVTLSVSLHAADDETRSSLMPINRRYGVGELLDACRRYFERTGRRISFEYALIAGRNDGPADARRLATALNRGLRSRDATMPIHVNLILLNPVEGARFRGPSGEAAAVFAGILEERGIRATVRRRLGADINAACGQLRRSEAPPAEPRPEGD